MICGFTCPDGALLYGFGAEQLRDLCAPLACPPPTTQPPPKTPAPNVVTPSPAAPCSDGKKLSFQQLLNQHLFIYKADLYLYFCNQVKKVLHIFENYRQ